MLAKIILAAAVLTAATPALAKTSQGQAPQVAVPYSHLDLGTESGMAALDASIRSAVRKVCPADPGLAELGRHNLTTQCIAETTARANRRVAEIAKSRPARA